VKRWGRGGLGFGLYSGGINGEGEGVGGGIESETART
jgi:hypothetical protein